MSNTVFFFPAKITNKRLEKLSITYDECEKDPLKAKELFLDEFDKKIELYFECKKDPKKAQELFLAELEKKIGLYLRYKKKDPELIQAFYLTEIDREIEDEEDPHYVSNCMFIEELKHKCFSKIDEVDSEIKVNQKVD